MRCKYTIAVMIIISISVLLLISDIGMTSSYFGMKTPLLMKMTKDDVLKMFGEPAKAQNDLGTLNWQYECSKGLLQISFRQFSMDYVDYVRFDPHDQV